MQKTTKRDRAIMLRNLALAAVRARGQWKECSGGPKFLTLEADGLIIAYRSPFQKLPPDSGETVRLAMVYGVMPKDNLPHGLDVWHGGKVLNIEWSDGGEIDVRSYKAGPWEKAIEALGDRQADDKP